MARPGYPFSAVVGQERLKLALLLNAVNPAVGGVLVKGEKGTAKSTTVRALAGLLPQIEVAEGCAYACDPHNPAEQCAACREAAAPLKTVRTPMRLITLPLNATEDRILGGIDFTRTLRTGETHFQHGLLARAHRGILYVDEVNLLDDHLVDLVLDAAASGVNVVEREGVSLSHAARFILVGSMNPEEGELRPQLLDRFGLCVAVESEKDIDKRTCLMQRREAFDTDPQGFCHQFAEEEEALARTIEEARARFKDVDFPTTLRRLVCEICTENQVAGHRADLVIEQAARAHAALKHRVEALLEDVLAVAPLALDHRRRRTSPRARKTSSQAGKTTGSSRPTSRPRPRRRTRNKIRSIPAGRKPAPRTSRPPRTHQRGPRKPRTRSSPWERPSRSGASPPGATASCAAARAGAPRL